VLAYPHNGIDGCIAQAGDGGPGVEDDGRLVGCGVEGEVGGGDSHIHSIHGDARHGGEVEGLEGVELLTDESRLCQSVPADGRRIERAEEQGRGCVGLCAKSDQAVAEDLGVESGHLARKGEATPAQPNDANHACNREVQLAPPASKHKILDRKCGASSC
jgi:hypothetical protein